VRELVLNALDATALNALQDSAEPIIARVDDPRYNVERDATATTDCPD
jgi:hypothetical protein